MTARSLPLLLSFVMLGACKRESPAPPAPSPSVSAEVKSASSVAAAKPPPPVKPPPNKPPLTAKVSTDGEAKRAGAAARLEKVQGAIEELANVIPIGCVAAEPVCRKRFEVFSLELAKLRAELARTAIPHCPKSNADDLAVEQMAGSQIAWLSRWVDDVETAGRAGLVDPGSVWDELKTAADKSHPRVASSCTP